MIDINLSIVAKHNRKIMAPSPPAKALPNGEKKLPFQGLLAKMDI